MSDDHFIRPDNDVWGPAMKPNRTPEQTEADRIDLEIFRMIRSTEAMQEKTRNMKWYGVKNRLVQARLLARDMMHPEDKSSQE